MTLDAWVFNMQTHIKIKKTENLCITNSKYNLFNSTVKSAAFGIYNSSWAVTVGHMTSILALFWSTLKLGDRHHCWCKHVKLHLYSTHDPFSHEYHTNQIKYKKFLPTIRARSHFSLILGCTIPAYPSQTFSSSLENLVQHHIDLSTKSLHNLSIHNKFTNNQQWTFSNQNILA